MAAFHNIVDNITQMLGCLENYIHLCNKQGCTDINVACENLVLGMMNIAYDYSLENYNSKKRVANAKGIDLIDERNGICVQVSSEHTTTKLKRTIENINLTESLAGYHLIYFALVEDTKNLRTSSICTTEKNIFIFNAKDDIIDFGSFCSDLKRLNPDKIQELNEFLCQWLGNDYYNSSTFKIKMNKRNQQECYEKPEDYYPRRINTAEKDDFSADMYLHPEKYRHTLIEYIQNEGVDDIDSNSKYWLLIAAGQTGKSYEVKNLAFLLSNSDNIFPVIFEAKNFKEGKRKLSLPFYCLPEHIVYIIDGIDEISGEELREAFYDEISRLKSENPELRILMTCRRNYIDNAKFPKFKRLFLNELSFEDIQQIVHESDINSPDDFLERINTNALYPMARNPFFLKAMMKYYNQNNEIQENRLELYRYLIDSSYNAEYDKRTSKVIHRKTEGNTLLKRIALIMQFTEKRSLSEEELKGEMLLNDSEIESCMSFAIFYRDETHNYSFELNSFQMYYVIEFLMHKSSEEILEFVSYKEKDVLRIRPEWYDVFELLLSSMKIEDKRRTYLLNWTFRNDIEALLNVDVNSLEDEFKDAIFKTILLDYKKKQIASSPYMDIYLYRKLASFCTTNESLRFFITEYKNETNIGPYLYLLSFVYWSIDKFYIDSSNLTKEYKDVVFQHLQKHGNFEETPWYEALYAPFHNNIFSTQEDIDRLIKLTKEISDVELKISIFRLIEKTDLCDEFIDFAISNERYIHKYKRKGEKAYHLVRRDSVLYVLTHIKKYESIKKLWINYSLLIKDNYGFNDDEIQQKFRRKILLLTEQHIKEHTDLIEDVKRAWIYGYKKNENLAHTPNPIAQDFRDFFVRNNLCTNTKKLCEDLYNALKDNRGYEELKQLYLEIILVINKDELNELAKKWDANDTYRCFLMSGLRNTPIQEINATVVKWINNKFVQAKTPYDNMPSYEQMNSDRITLIFDRSHFKETINHIIKKLAPINSKDLRKKIRANKKEQISRYIMQYLQGYEDRKSEKYDINAIKESLENDIAYYCFIANVLEQNDKVEFNLSQKKIIEKALKYLASNRESIISFQIVLRLILRFEIDLDKDTIIDLLPYAGVHYYRNSQKEKYRYFIDYAREKLGNDVIKRNLPKLISPDCQIHDESHLIKIAELIVRLRMAELYSEICKRIKESIYKKIEFTHILFEDKNKGIEALKLQFKNFSSNVQIYILEELSLIPKHQKWTLETTVKYKSSYTSEENKSVLLILLRLGYDKALDECIKYLTNNSRLQAPTLNYTDVRYLPKLLILLQIMWNDKDSYNHWRARINETLTKMAEKNLEQYNAVNESLRKMIEEDRKFSNLNYFIEELKRSDPRLKEAQISIAQALKIIDGD